MDKQIYHSLTCESLAENITYFRYQPLRSVVHLDYPATDTFIDFHHQQPPTIAANIPIDDALNIIKNQSLHILLVVNEAQQITGVVTASDILGDKPVELVQLHRRPRSEITVNMVMTPTHLLKSIRFASLSNAQIGHVVQTLIELNADYLLVTDRTSEQSDQLIVRGLFLRSLLSKQLNQDLSTITHKNHSVLELTS